MFDRFTDRARKVMGLSRQEAQRFNHDYIGTEHILLGLIQEGSGVAADVLKNLDVDPKRIRQEIEKLVSHGTTMVTMGQLPFTPRAKKVLELVLEEAQRLGHNYIGTEHLLLGLVREEKGIAGQALRSLNLLVEDVREEVRELLGHDDEGAEPVDEPGPLTAPAREAMDLASLIAHHEQHEAIDTEHILLGIIDGGSGGGTLANLLLGRLRAEVVKHMQAGTAVIPKAPVALTPGARVAVDHAFLAARDGGATRVDVPHLLAGLLREKEGIAARVLLANDLDPETVLAAAPPRPRDEDSGGPRMPEHPAPDPIGRMSGDNRNAMGLARLEAQRFQHDTIGTEHVLLGLLARRRAATRLLRKLGVDPERVRQETEKRMTRGNAWDAAGQLPFTPSVKTALELALAEADAHDHAWIGEEHLLLGLVREGHGTAAQVLASLGVTVQALWQAIDPGPPAPPEMTSR
ncbi:MAG TPA: Clp protease N-terminal domain-containing protein [Planctomycetota bacterium]|nr:Clp protease N-terminal domain-containing protein [Planctomycetota bacterium]